MSLKEDVRIPAINMSDQKETENVSKALNAWKENDDQFYRNRPNALSAQAPPSGAKERLIVTKHNLDLMNVTNYS